MLDFTGKTNTTPTTNAPSKGRTMNNYPIQDSSIEPREYAKFGNQLRRLAKTLDSANLNIPESLTQGPMSYEQQANQLVTELAQSSTENHLDKAAEATLNGEDPTPHLLNAAAWDRRLGLNKRILELSRAKYVEQVNDNADNITEQLRKNDFTPAIRRLKTLLTKHPDKPWNLDLAVSSGDYAHAAIIKDNQDIADTLHEAITIRGLIYNDEAFTTPAAYITKPGYKGKVQTADLNWWATIINAGYTPHLPTANEWEALEQSEPFTKHREAEAKKIAEFNATEEPQIVQNLMHEGRQMSR
ncbi:hypothetical protein M2368_001419 [Arthrobacter sp. JUb119]|nr:hypothetical protein [Arthrobacter sp. JUb119]